MIPINNHSNNILAYMNYAPGISQLRICRPLFPAPPLSFHPVFMDDARCAETNEK